MCRCMRAHTALHEGCYCGDDPVTGGSLDGASSSTVRKTRDPSRRQAGRKTHANGESLHSCEASERPQGCARRLAQGQRAACNG